MEKFLEKRITMRFLMYVVALLIFAFGTINMITDHSVIVLRGKLIEYEHREKSYVACIDSLDKKYNSLYGNLDSLYILNWKNVGFWVDYYNIKNKEIVISQIEIESGNLTSNLCVEHGNLVGMHFPRVRKTTATGYIKADGGADVATYSFWWKSIQDYRYWQDYFGYVHELPAEDYLTVLTNHGASGYAEAGDYINKVKTSYDGRFSNDMITSVN